MRTTAGLSQAARRIGCAIRSSVASISASRISVTAAAGPATSVRQSHARPRMRAADGRRISFAGRSRQPRGGPAATASGAGSDQGIVIRGETLRAAFVADLGDHHPPVGGEHVTPGVGAAGSVRRGADLLDQQAVQPRQVGAGEARVDAVVVGV
jgi:hypothetical protein